MRSKLLILLCLPLASVAAAQDFHFAYSAADLVSPESLYVQLSEAVEQHCRDNNDIRDLRQMKGCESTLMDLAVEQIDQPQLTAYAQSPRDGGKS